MLVKDVMTNDPVTVTDDTPVKVAITHLARHRITAMPVLTRSGRLCGVVSEADLIRDLVDVDQRAHEIPLDEQPWHDRPCVVGDVMTPHAVTVRPETELATAVELITSTSVKSVPVVDAKGRLVGMLSRGDVVQMLARADADLEREVGALLTSVGLDDWAAEVTDGAVSLSGPDGSTNQGLARVVASTVPGVVEVRVA
jgi:CBS-domain-containing membrane protein